MASPTGPLSGAPDVPPPPMPGPPNTGPQIDPSTPPAAPPSVPAQTGVWSSVLQGALMGLAGVGNVRGRGGFGTGVGAGAENVERQNQIQTENQQRQQQISSDVQFKSAQSALMVTQGRIDQKQLDALPQKIQDEHTDQVLTQLEHIKQIFPGVQITVTPNDQKSIMAAMASETKNNGGVGPALHLNAGDKMYSVDLNSLSSSPAGLVLVNDAFRKMGKQPLDAAIWANMDTQARNTYLTNAANFGTETPSDSKVTEYKGYLATVKDKPDYPQKVADIADLEKSIGRFQNGADAAAQTQAARKGADKAAELSAETTPENMAKQVDLTKAKATGEAQVKQVFDNKPVYAVDSTGKTIMTTQAAVNANTSGFSSVRPVKETDVRSDQHDIKVLNDIQVKSDGVKTAAAAMDSNSWGQAVGVAKYLTDHPETTSDSIVNSKILAGLTPQARTYVINVLSLRESAMGLQKVLTGSARSNDAQIKALQATLPGFESNSGVVGQKLGAFDQNLGMLSQGLPENTGVAIQVKPAQSSGQGVSLKAAMALPINKGKNEAEVRGDIQAHGHQVAP
jgi:hypothetical protein